MCNKQILDNLKMQLAPQAVVTIVFSSHFRNKILVCFKCFSESPQCLICGAVKNVGWGVFNTTPNTFNTTLSEVGDDDDVSVFVYL